MVAFLCVVGEIMRFNAYMVPPFYFLRLSMREISRRFKKRESPPWQGHKKGIRDKKCRFFLFLSQNSIQKSKNSINFGKNSIKFCQSSILQNSILL